MALELLRKYRKLRTPCLKDTAISHNLQNLRVYAKGWTHSVDSRGIQHFRIPYCRCNPALIA